MTDILITPELIEAIEIVEGPTEPYAVGKLPSKEALRASVTAFRDAFNVLEGAEQMLEQAIRCADDYHNEVWVNQCEDFLEDLKATNDYIRSHKLFGEFNRLEN